jgi:hypothetical protein
MNMIFISSFTTPLWGWKLDKPTKSCALRSYVCDASAR